MSDGRKYIHESLLKLMDQADRENGLFINDLQAGDALVVETMGSVYTLNVLDPKNSQVEATGTGSHYSTPTITWVNGSSLTGTGSMVKLGWVAVGYRLLVGNILFSETRRVLVNGIQILPKKQTLPQ